MAVGRKSGRLRTVQPGIKMLRFISREKASCLTPPRFMREQYAAIFCNIVQTDGWQSQNDSRLTTGPDGIERIRPPSGRGGGEPQLFSIRTPGKAFHAYATEKHRTVSF